MDVEKQTTYIFSTKDYEMLCKHSKYAPRIVITLYNCHDSLNVIELAFILGVKQKRLVNIIRNLEPFDILHYRQYPNDGWFCSLTPKGYEFYEYLMNIEFMEK